MLGAWALMELKSGVVDQKFCNATHVADETQMCTIECTVDTLENWTSPGGIDRQLVSETQKGENDKAAVDRSKFAQLGKELENGCNRNCMKVSYVIVFWSNQRMRIKGKVLELTEQGNPTTIQ